MEMHPVYFGEVDTKRIVESLNGIGKNYSRVFVLADRGIPPQTITAFTSGIPSSSVFVIEGGESVKDIAFIQQIWQFLLQNKADRSSLLINIGGGAVCDAGAFAAATYKRGIDFVHVPSTLLSMVDASVGGKTGINFGSVKNTVGTFSMPVAVFIHNKFLESLPHREMLSGYAEIIKHGLVYDANHLHVVMEAFQNEQIPGLELIKESIAIKSTIVQNDPHEKGERQLLNFGHTIGHGIESYLSEKHNTSVLHGEAVALGMVAEMYISSEITGFPENITEKYSHSLRKLTQHITLSAKDFPAVIDKVGNDKKNQGNEIGVTLLQAEGKGIWGQTISESLIERALNRLISENR